MEWKLLLVLAIVVLLVVGVNGLLVLAMRRGDKNSGIRLMQRAAQQARSPWKDEDDKLKELSAMVDKLTPPENDKS